jgi:hypothetical protein
MKGLAMNTIKVQVVARVAAKQWKDFLSGDDEYGVGFNESSKGRFMQLPISDIRSRESIFHITDWGYHLMPSPPPPCNVPCDVLCAIHMSNREVIITRETIDQIEELINSNKPKRS